MMSSRCNDDVIVRMVKKLTINDKPTPVKALVAAFLHNNDEVIMT